MNKILIGVGIITLFLLAAWIDEPENNQEVVSKEYQASVVKDYCSHFKKEWFCENN